MAAAVAAKELDEGLKVSPLRGARTSTRVGLSIQLKHASCAPPRKVLKASLVATPPSRPTGYPTGSPWPTFSDSSASAVFTGSCVVATVADTVVALVTVYGIRCGVKGRTQSGALGCSLPVHWWGMLELDQHLPVFLLFGLDYRDATILCHYGRVSALHPTNCGRCYVVAGLELRLMAVIPGYT